MFKIERMTEEANKKKRAVESEIMDTTTLQVYKQSSSRTDVDEGYFFVG